MDHVAGPLHILFAEKEGRIWFNIVCLKLYEFEKISWWCLYALESILEYVLESTLKSILEYVLLKKKNNIVIMVSQNLRQATFTHEHVDESWLVCEEL